MSPNACQILSDVSLALQEDVGSGDITANLLEDTSNTAVIITREPMVLCGLPWADVCFKSIDSSLIVESLCNDGETLEPNRRLMRITGNSRSILTAERTALNFLQTLSGVATKTAFFCAQIKHTGATLLDTRKTLPGLRYAQKYAVQCGGGKNHRMGLYDAFLIKENHIKACGSIKHAIDRAKQSAQGQLLEVEVENLDEFSRALEYRPDVIMLDNFSLEEIAKAVAMNSDGAVKLEASGGVSLDNLVALAETGIDYISVGELTKSVTAIDLSLRFIEE